MALVNNPRVLFFDEPTAGLDPQVRREIYDIIEELRREKKTIVITTHYIEEAERLCDRVAIVDHGKVIAIGTPQELKNRSGDKTRIEVQLARPESPETLKALDGVTDCRDLNGGYALHTQRPPQAIVSLVKHLEAQGNELVSLNIMPLSVSSKTSSSNSPAGDSAIEATFLTPHRDAHPVPTLRNTKCSSSSA